MLYNDLQPAPNTEHEFYEQCRKHDWLSDFSDDMNYVRAGERDFARLQRHAKVNKRYMEILDAFVEWFYDGCAGEMPKLEDIK